MNKYIKNEENGISKLNIDLVCKNWNDNFIIYSHQDEDYNKIVILGKNNRVILNSKIGNDEAMTIVSKLNLVLLKDSLFRKSGSYHTKEFIISDRKGILENIEETELKLKVLNSMLKVNNDALSKL